MKKTQKWLSAMLVLTMITSIFSGATAAAATTPYIKSDTSASMSVQKDGTYTFKMTLVGTAKEKPSFTVGNGAILKLSLVKQTGNDYYVKIVGSGQVGSSTGVYSTIKGQSPKLQAVVKILEKVNTYDFCASLNWTYNKTNASSKSVVKNWTGNTTTQILWGEDEYSNAEITVANSNPDVVKITRHNGEIMGASFTANATEAGKHDYLKNYIWSPDGSLSDMNYFYTEGIKAGTSTITITSKSPTTGEVFTDTQYWTILDSSKAVITSDTPTNITLKQGASYSFKLTASAEAMALGVDFYTWADFYYKNEYRISGCGRTQITYKGNGVYIVKVTPVYQSEAESVVRKGDTLSLVTMVTGMQNKNLCDIKIV